MSSVPQFNSCFSSLLSNHITDCGFMFWRDSNVLFRLWFHVIIVSAATYWSGECTSFIPPLTQQLNSIFFSADELRPQHLTIGCFLINVCVFLCLLYKLYFLFWNEISNTDYFAFFMFETETSNLKYKDSVIRGEPIKQRHSYNNRYKQDIKPKGKSHKLWWTIRTSSFVDRMHFSTGLTCAFASVRLRHACSSSSSSTFGLRHPWVSTGLKHASGSFGLRSQPALWMWFFRSTGNWPLYLYNYAFIYFHLFIFFLFIIIIIILLSLI